MIDWILDALAGDRRRRDPRRHERALRAGVRASGRRTSRDVGSCTTTARRSNEDRLGAIGDIALRARARRASTTTCSWSPATTSSSDDLADFGRVRAASGTRQCSRSTTSATSPRCRSTTRSRPTPRARITFFEEKPARADEHAERDRALLLPAATLPLIRQYLAEGNNPDQPGRLVAWLYPRVAFYTWRVPGRWYDIGSAETLREADEVFSRS